MSDYRVLNDTQWHLFLALSPSVGPKGMADRFSKAVMIEIINRCQSEGTCVPSDFFTTTGNKTLFGSRLVWLREKMIEEEQLRQEKKKEDERLERPGATLPGSSS